MSFSASCPSPSSPRSPGSESSSSEKELPTLQWVRHTSTTRGHFAVSPDAKKQSGFDKVMKLLREAEGEKMVAKGKRVPFSIVSSNTAGARGSLKKFSESKRCLKNVQSRLGELC